MPSRRIPGSPLLTEIERRKAIIRAATLRLRYNDRPDSDIFVIYYVGTRFASLAAANPDQLREQRFAVSGSQLDWVGCAAVPRAPAKPAAPDPRRNFRRVLMAIFSP